MPNFVEIEITLNILDKTNKIIQDTDISNEKLAYFRDDIRKDLFFLQEGILEKNSSSICKYITFPVLAYIDEKIMLLNNINPNINWGLLQLEYYDRKDGGEYVFHIIDSILSDKIYPDICYQVILFILDAGFLGQFYENPYNHNFTKYKKSIMKRVAVSKEVKGFFDGHHKKEILYKNDRFWTKLLIILGVPLSLFILSLIVFLF